MVSNVFLDGVTENRQYKSSVISCSIQWSRAVVKVASSSGELSCCPVSRRVGGEEGGGGSRGSNEPPLKVNNGGLKMKR